LVDPAARGRGIGTQLLHEAMKLLGEMRTIRLDATPAGHAIYHKLDFLDEYRLSRMEATNTPLLPVADNPARPITPADLPELFEFDREVFGADRSVLLEWMLAGAPEYAWVVRRSDRITGYSFGRHGFAYEHIGPVIAHDRESAQHLVAASLAGGRAGPVILDVPRHDPEWVAWLESRGFTEQRPFIRMFYGEHGYPGMPERQFAIIGPEFS
jgi:hypothetical protein